MYCSEIESRVFFALKNRSAVLMCVNLFFNRFFIGCLDVYKSFFQFNLLARADPVLIGLVEGWQF